MTWTIYGIRLKGDPEVRYIGMTGKAIARRLKQHRQTPCVPNLSPWLRENECAVEVFPIASVASECEARATEKVIIALCVRLGHRLFNRAHVERHGRWQSDRTTPAKRARCPAAAHPGPRTSPARPAVSRSEIPHHGERL